MILIVLFLPFLFYVISIGTLIYGFTKVKTCNSTNLKPETAFTIIVPFRNEAENLPLLLESISKLNYPMDLLEVVLVDDDSEAKFQPADFQFSILIINNIRVSNSPKKDAIATAIPLVKTPWIITTDADCLVAENWLLTLDNYIQSHRVSMIAGAVIYSSNKSFLDHFQQLDLASLQGATIGSFGIGKGFMCNGANLAYTKSLFQELNGFEGNDSIASGDDVFLLQKALLSQNFGIEKVHYLKSQNNIVTTNPVVSWQSLFYQRVRWASKTSSYQSNFGKILALIVFAGNVCLIASIFFLNPYLFSIVLLVKISIDSILIVKTNYFLSKKTQYLLLSSLLYPFFSVSVALYSLFGKYEWKGRKF